MVRRVSAGLHLWPRGPEGEPGLRHLERRAHVPNGGGQLLHVFLLVEDLLHSARQVGPQVSVSRIGVCDTLLERSENSEYDRITLFDGIPLVGVDPVLLYVVVLSVEDIIHISPQPLRS